VADIAAATAAAAEHRLPAGQLRAFNVGSGTPRTVGELATALSRALGGPAPVLTGEFRLGDVRHIPADSSRLRAELGWQPRRGFEAGMAELAGAWFLHCAARVGGQPAETAFPGHTMHFQ
jgi:dTDP-L-rhamnose 4-epimerase